MRKILGGLAAGIFIGALVIFVRAVGIPGFITGYTLQDYEKEREERWRKIEEPKKRIKVVIDYEKEAWKPGKQEYMDEEVNHGNFPKHPWEIGKKEVTFRVFANNESFDPRLDGSSVTTKEVLKRMEELECRPATLQEFFAFREVISQVPIFKGYRHIGIVVLGSVWREPAKYKGAYLRYNTSADAEVSKSEMKTVLVTTNADNGFWAPGWDQQMYFLGVFKE